MVKAGLKIMEHINSLSMMGFTEVLRHLPYMIRVMKETVAVIREQRPDRIILIDYPGFNLRLARHVHALGIPITYFILPQVWAWKEKRVNIIRDTVDQALSIFPFEPYWFQRRRVAVDFVGHPFMDQQIEPARIGDFLKRHQFVKERPIAILLPGSRQQEVDRHWPVFVDTIRILKLKRSDLQIVLGLAPSVKMDSVPDFINIETQDITAAIEASTVALAASGTVTLEAAVLDTPVVVCYRLSGLSWLMAKYLVNIPFASMANLIAGKQVVPEFLQSAMTPGAIAESMEPLMEPTAIRKTMLTGFEQIRRDLGVPGVYQRAARAILQRMEVKT